MNNQIMNEAMSKLEFSKIRAKLEHYAVTYLGQRHIQQLAPLTQPKAIRHRLGETEEARRLLEARASVPLPSLEGIELVLDLLGTGYVLTERDLGHIAQFLRSCRQLIKYMAAKGELAPTISSYAASMQELDQLLNEIETSIHGGRIVDHASKELAKIRKKIQVTEERIKRKLDQLLNRHQSILMEHVISKRAGRYVLPVKKEYRKQIKGTLLDESASGQTVFIEPQELLSLQMELSLLQSEEAKEETKILSELTGLTERYEQELRINVDTVGMYDFILARGKYALAIGGRNVSLNQEGYIHLIGAVHPLLGAAMIPLDFRIGRGYRSLIITGPNTGGKTSALKTIGLITLMVQSGLLVPVQEGSEGAIFEEVAVDIGDGQSLEHALSTFSAHIRNIKDILLTAGTSTLVLLDEMASGTDPGEGVGLSIAILEELHRRQATVVVTTHFTEIKNFAARSPGFENARMEFDTETLEPLYRLRIGEAGHSYAFVIAARLGIPEAIIARSREISQLGRSVDLSLDHEPDRISERGSDQDAQDASLGETVISSQPAVPDSEETAPPYFRQEPAVTEAEHAANEAATRPKFRLGDRVYIPYLKRSGTVYDLPDGRGNVGVMIQNDKVRINHKRLKPFIGAEELYPEEYDLDIVFESKENRKKRNLMKRKHVEGLTIETKPESP